MMTENTDPPVSGQTPSDDDNWDDVVFDDTEVPLDGVKKPRGSQATKLAIGLIVVMALAGGGYYWLTMQAPPATPVTPASLAMQQNPAPEPVDLQAMASGTDNAAAMPAPVDMAGNPMPEMSDDEFNTPDEGVETVENIDLNSLVESDSQIEMPEWSETNPQDMPGAPMDNMAADANADTMPMDTTDTMGVVDDPFLSDNMAADTAPDATMMGTDSTGTQPVDMMMTDTSDPSVDMMAGMQAPPTDMVQDAPAMNITPAQPPAISPEQAEIDQQLEQELIASLTSDVAPPQNPAAPAQTAEAADEALIRQLEERVDQTRGDNSRIEADAYIRPTPEKYYVIERTSAPVQMDRDLSAAKRALAEGRNSRALEMFNALYEANPSDTRVLLGRGVALQRLGQYSEAIAVYEQVLRDNPENLEALTNMLGILSVQNPAYSMDHLQRLHTRYPSNAGVKVQLALAYGAMNYTREATGLLLSAYNLEPNNPTVAYNLAVMYDRMGDRVNAAMYYRRALVLERDSGYRGAVPVEAIQNRLTTLY